MTEKNPKQKERKAMEEQKKPKEQKETLQKERKEEKKIEKKSEEKQKIKRPKKTEAKLDIKGIAISTKQAVAVCKFIKGKKIEEAIKDLGDVIAYKKAVPMKGETPHRKGMMSGRYPKKAVQEFIKLLKSLQANANYNGLGSPIIIEAIANIGSRPYGRFGRIRRKRTNIKLKVKEMQR